MRRTFLILLVAILVFSNITSASAVDETNESIYLTIATADNRIITVDRLVCGAFHNIGIHTAFSSTYLQTGYEMANSGKLDGVIASTPDIEQSYTNLIRVDVPVEQTNIFAFVKEGSPINIKSWNDLSGLRVGTIIQRNYILSKIPADAKPVVIDSDMQLLNMLNEGHIDVAISGRHAHELISLPEGVKSSGVIDMLPEYLYLNSSLEHLVPTVKAELNKLVSSGEAEEILSGNLMQGIDSTKTVLHIISSNTEVEKEDIFYASVREQTKDLDGIEWYTLSLSSRRYMQDPDRITSVSRLLRRDLVTKDVKAIVVSGEYGLKFLSECYSLFFKDVPVLFYGVSNDYADYVKDFSNNFTGIIEKVPAEETISLALELFPNTKNIFVVNDDTLEGKNYRSAIEEQLREISDYIAVEYNDNVSRDALMQHMRELPADSVILFGSYFCDKNGQYYSLNEMTRFMEQNCSVPIFSIYSTTAAYDAIGGKASDYGKYGEEMAGMLKQILNGRPAADIPLVMDSSKYNRWVFNKAKIDVFNINENNLPNNSLVLNKAPSMWEANPQFAATLVLLFVIAVSVGIGVTIFVSKYKKQKELLIKDQTIREVKERLEQLINTAPVAYILSLLDGTIVETNDYVKKYIGMLPGHNTTQYFTHPKERQNVINRVHVERSVENQIIEYNLIGGESNRFISNLTAVEHNHSPAIISWAMNIEELERYKDQMRLERHNLQAVLDTMPIPVSIVDNETMMMAYGNDAYLSLLEYRMPSELYGVYIGDLISPIQNSGLDATATVARLLLNPDPDSLEIQTVTSKGNIIDTRVYTRQIDYNGRNSTIGILVDLTKEKEYKNAQQNLQTALDMLPTPTIILDVATRDILYANNAAYRLFEVNQNVHESDLSIRMFIGNDGNDGKAFISKLTGISHADPVSIELECRKAGGDMFTGLLSACLVDYNGRQSLLGIIEDLTAKKEYERMLLNTAEKEKEANQLKSRFLVNMSHEIRTPMNAIIGLTEIELRKNLARDISTIYKKINMSAKNLLQIINDVLDLSKIEADKVELFCEPVELEDVINNAMLVATPRLDEKNVEFMLNTAPDLPRFIIADKTRLWQILKNFMDNSAKYTEAGRIVLGVSIDHEKSDDETVYLTFIVEDTGIGISEEQKEKIFQPYSQVYSKVQKRYTGTGLGLVISKQLCELMGGTIEIESSLGQGTRVSLTIPFKRCNDKMKADAAENLAGMNILAVDDDDLSLEIMERLITSAYAKCVTASSGEEAIEILFKKRDEGELFDAILLDYLMDGMNGIETASYIHEHLGRSVKVLMVTAYQRMLIKDDFGKNGISDVIEKPFIPSQFIKKIKEATGHVEEDSSFSDQELEQYKDVHVLLFEDYFINQEVATGMFAEFGVETTIGEDGKKGIDILYANKNAGKHFDLIFMDLQMPVMDGYEAAALIRSDHDFDDIPIVSLTADAMKEVAERCRASGMNDHIAKPIEFSSLQEIFRRWLPKSKLLNNQPKE